MFILKGFATVLECSDHRLGDFQKAILELVTDVNTPDTLTAYLGILANGTQPPIEMLLPRLIFLGSHGQRAQPNAYLRFPTIDGIGIIYFIKIIRNNSILEC